MKPGRGDKKAIVGHVRRTGVKRTRKWQVSSLGQAMAKFVTRTDRKEW